MQQEGQIVITDYLWLMLLMNLQVLKGTKKMSLETVTEAINTGEATKEPRRIIHIQNGLGEDLMSK